MCIEAQVEKITQLFEKLPHEQFFVLTDKNAHQHCYPIIAPYLPQHHLFIVEAGETHKNIQTCTQIWNAMTQANLTRQALSLHLGGGVIGDMGGFCAATYKRGIDFIQIPTTLLAQVDASIGGKVGIDFQGYKNQIGVFQMPLQVWVLPPFLQTLPQKETLAGFAEVIKHILIADANQWQKIHTLQTLPNQWIAYLEHSIELKKRITQADPHEKGLRKILNFGHTIGHALETYLLQYPQRAILHGEAVAIGIVAESYLSQQRELISENDLEQICQLIQRLYPPINIAENELPHIAQIALQDKKNSTQAIRTVLLKKIGEALYDQPISLVEIQEALRFYIRRTTKR
ncbi:MAG: 3-dehydroquinate synthase [Cytophagales bacterium]|nr:MAG: 3-dehydroquinate synthase [Cytophagales bacterium]